MTALSSAERVHADREDNRDSGMPVPILEAPFTPDRIVAALEAVAADAEGSALGVHPESGSGELRHVRRLGHPSPCGDIEHQP